MDNVEVAETHLGKYVPLHLLKFDGDPQLQSSFRQIIEVNYEKGIVKSECGLCEACGLPLSNKSRICMRPSKKKTQKVLKLLLKASSGALFGKYKNFLLQRYQKSCTKMIVWCHRCRHLNRENLVSNETKQALKDNTFQQILAAAEEDRTSTPSQKRKKKKRKKVKSNDQDNCGLNIPSTPRPSQTETRPDHTASLYRPLVRSPQAMQGDMSTLNGRSLSHPVSSSSNLRQPSGSVKAASLSQKRKGLVDLNSTPGKKIKTSLKQKDLKKLLTTEQHEEKRASLADFLSSL